MFTDNQKKVLRIAARKAVLRAKGLTYADLGHRAAICHVITERRATPSIRKLIARRLRIPMRDLWSDDFGIGIQ